MSDLWGVLLGGFLTIAGGAIGQILQSRDKVRDRETARNQAMRQKAEECLIIIAKFRLTFETRLYEGVLLRGGSTSEGDADYAHMTAKCSTYFPGTLQIIRSARKVAGKALDDFRDRTSDESREQYAKALASHMSEKMVALCVLLENYISEQVEAHYVSDLR